MMAIVVLTVFSLCISRSFLLVAPFISIQPFFRFFPSFR
jgi:hypothetical protein